jgi:hypothetical protein
MNEREQLEYMAMRNPHAQVPITRHNVHVKTTQAIRELQSGIIDTNHIDVLLEMQKNPAEGCNLITTDMIKASKTKQRLREKLALKRINRME